MNEGGPINYDRLWADYQRSLVDTLRGFSSGLEALGLAHFVPDEDPTLSLRNLLDAAASAGHTGIALRFGPATRGRVDAQALRALAAGYGRARILATESEVVVAVEELHAAALLDVPAAVPRASARAVVPAPATAPTPASSKPADHVYAAALAAVTTFAHRGRPAPAALAIDTALEEATLLLQIDPGTHTITTAHFMGVPAALLERFCALITGLPLLEAAHHGVVQLEAALRAPNIRPVAGIVTPRAAHPMFALPAALIRTALASYRARTGYGERVSRHDPGPGPAWKAASEGERAARIAAVIPSGTDTAVLVAIEHDVRLVFALPEHLDSQARQRLLFELEGRIQRAIDPRLEVFAEERKDRNKLRRLGTKATPTGAP